MKSPELKIEQDTYPSGKPFVKIRLGYEIIGSYTHENDGFLVFGCRKPVKTEREAQVKVIKRYVQRHIKLAANAAQLLEQFPY